MELIGTTGDYGRRLRAAVIGFGATARGAVTALNAHGVHDVTCSPTACRRCRPHRSTRRRSCTSTPTPTTPASASRSPTTAGAAGAVPRRPRHRRQLRAAGHRRAIDLRHRPGPQRVPAGNLIVDVSCDEGWASAGPPDVVRRADASRSATTSTTTPSTTALAPVELRHLGDQRGAAAAPAAGAGRPRRVGGRPTIRRAIEIRDGEIQNPNSCPSNIAATCIRTRSCRAGSCAN